MAADARQLGIDALRAGRFADAAKHLSAFIGSAPNDHEARLAFALALSGRGDHDKALIHLDKLLTKTPNSASLHFHRGQILERAKRLDQARREFRRVLELDPKYEKARAKLNTVSANVGFEVIDDEPQFEVVDDVAEIEIAKTVDEEIVQAKSVGEGDDVMNAEEFEEVWGDERKKLDAGTIAKYCVLLLAVIGASVFGFYMFSQNLAVIFTAGIGTGAILLGVADFLHRPGNSGTLFWLLHSAGLTVLIATVVGVMIGHRMNKADEAEREPDPTYAASPDMVRGKTPYVAPIRPADDVLINRMILELGTGIRGRQITALTELSTMQPNNRRDEVTNALKLLLQGNEQVLRTNAAKAAKLWGNRTLLPELKKLLNDGNGAAVQHAREAIAAIEKQP